MKQRHVGRFKAWREEQIQKQFELKLMLCEEVEKKLTKNKSQPKNNMTILKASKFLPKIEQNKLKKASMTPDRLNKIPKAMKVKILNN